MKKIEWTNGNKMKIETGHKGFDSACSAIFTGNAWTGTQTSNHIRPMTEIECNGLVKPIGHLHNFDLKQFRHLSQNIRDYLKSMRESVILYSVFHHTGGGLRVQHGYVVTDKNHRFMMTFMSNQRQKSHNVVYEFARYVSDFDQANNKQKYA